MPGIQFPHQNDDAPPTVKGKVAAYEEQQRRLNSSKPKVHIRQQAATNTRNNRTKPKEPKDTPREMQQQNQQNHTLKGENQKLAGQLEWTQQGENYFESPKRMQQLTQHFDTLKGENQILAGQVKWLTEGMQQLTEHFDTLEGENQILAGQVKWLTEGMQQQEQFNDTIKGKNQSLAEQVKELKEDSEQKLFQHSETITVASTNIQSLGADLEQTRTQLNDAINTVWNQTQNLTGDVCTLKKGDYETYDVRISNCECGLTVHDRRLDKLEMPHGSHEGRIKDCEGTLTQHEERLDYLEMPRGVSVQDGGLSGDEPVEYGDAIHPTQEAVDDSEMDL